MGICSSRDSRISESAHEPRDVIKPAADGAAHDSHNSSATADNSREVGQEPAKQVPSSESQTPKPAVSVEDHASTPMTPAPVVPDASPQASERKMHKYNSMEKPGRSALRASEATSADGFSRKSTSNVSSVEFSVGIDAPDAEDHHRTFVGTDSISLKKIVDMFYEKVVADPELGRFFQRIDLNKLKRHQVRFMALAFGGKELVFQEDPNLNLRKVHYHLIRDQGLDLSHWERFVGLFDDTMDQLEKEIPPETRQAASMAIRATRHYFVPIGQETEYTAAPLIDVPDPVVDEDAKPAAAAQ